MLVPGGDPAADVALEVGHVGAPRLIFLVVSSAKQRSTRLSHDDGRLRVARCMRKSRLTRPSGLHAAIHAIRPAVEGGQAQVGVGADSADGHRRRVAIRVGQGRARLGRLDLDDVGAHRAEEP